MAGTHPSLRKLTIRWCAVFIVSFVTAFVGGSLYSLIEIKAIKEVAVASITEQLATVVGALIFDIWLWLVSISDEDSLSEIALSGASKLASTYFTLFYKSVHVLYTGIGATLGDQARARPITSIIIHTELLVAKIKSCIPRSLWGGQYFFNIARAIFF